MPSSRARCSSGSAASCSVRGAKPKCASACSTAGARVAERGLGIGRDVRREERLHVERNPEQAVRGALVAFRRGDGVGDGAGVPLRVSPGAERLGRDLMHLVEGQAYAVVHGGSPSSPGWSGVPYTGSPSAAQAAGAPARHAVRRRPRSARAEPRDERPGTPPPWQRPRRTTGRTTGSSAVLGAPTPDHGTNDRELRRPGSAHAGPRDERPGTPPPWQRPRRTTGRTTGSSAVLGARASRPQVGRRPTGVPGARLARVPSRAAIAICRIECEDAGVTRHPGGTT